MMIKGALTQRIREVLRTQNDLDPNARECLAEAAILLEVAVESESKIWDLVPVVVSRLVPQNPPPVDIHGNPFTQ